MHNAHTDAAESPAQLECRCDGQSGWYMGEDTQGREVARRCPACAARGVANSFGGIIRIWGTWQPIPELEPAVQKLRAWRGGTAAWSCLLHAGPGAANFGAGKTHAAQATAHEWAMRGMLVRYQVTAELIEAHRRVFDGETRPRDLSAFEGLVILDDLGAEAATEFARSLVDGICDARYRRRWPTLIATNLDVTALEKRYPRLLSRLFDGLVISWVAPDWRRR